METFMKNLLVLSASTALLSGILLITGCSSDDSSSGASGGSAAVPANAILIDSSAKAESTAVSAVVTGVAIVSVFAVETSTTLTGTDILNIAIDKVLNNRQGSSSIATGVDLSGDFCPSGGSASGDEAETSTTYIATVNFNACSDGSTTLTGTFSINATFTVNEDGPYTVNASGDLTATFGSDSLGFNGFSFIQSGDDGTGAFTTTTFTYAINPSAGGGFAVQLTQSLVGNEFVSCQLTSGQVLVTGAAGSQARATVNSDGSVKIEYHSGDGNFVETDNSPLLCLF